MESMSRPRLVSRGGRDLVLESRLGLRLGKGHWCRDLALVSRPSQAPSSCPALGNLRSESPRPGQCARNLCSTVQCTRTMHLTQFWVWVTIHEHCSLTLFMDTVPLKKIY